MVNKTLSADLLEVRLPDLIQAGVEELPKEACGLLTDEGQIVFLSNEAERPNSSYYVSGEQLGMAIEALYGEIKDISVLQHLVIWHTHPSGYIGPSRGDLKARRQPILNELAHLVIALPNGETTYF